MGAHTDCRDCHEEGQGLDKGEPFFDAARAARRAQVRKGDHIMVNAIDYTITAICKEHEHDLSIS